MTTTSLTAQDIQPSAPAWAPAIEDNSFFIEEAYNQEAGVVQHISNVTYTSSPERTLIYTFTQEWPVWSHRHQLSFTIPYSWSEGVASHGLGDILLNYRYQVTDHEDWAAIAPRISLVVASGNEYDGKRSGLRGIQLDVPASKRITNDLVVHVNAGITRIAEIATPEPPTPNRLTGYHQPTSFNVGASIIWLAGPKTNFLIEYVNNVVDEQLDWYEWKLRSEHTISPGIRQAIDIGTLQIVPGVAMPILIADGETQLGTFLYLSFEHPF